MNAADHDIQLLREATIRLQTAPRRAAANGSPRATSPDRSDSGPTHRGQREKATWQGEVRRMLLAESERPQALRRDLDAPPFCLTGEGDWEEGEDDGNFKEVARVGWIRN